MQWSEKGAQKSLNHYALPAAVIIINQPTIEFPRWTTIDTEVATNEFLISIESELQSNNELKAIAQKYRDDNIRDLLARNFSSVHVIYVPLHGYGQCGSSETIHLQTERLRDRIRLESERVQQNRAQAWTRFDSKTLSILFTYAFEHLARGNDAPFDFSTCRKQSGGPPTSITEHIAKFLSFNPRAKNAEDFRFAAKVIGSCLVRHELRQNGTDLLLHSSVIFNDTIKGYCIKALNEFYERDAECMYMHIDPAVKCVNTKAGHAKGHQSQSGLQIAPGHFQTNQSNIRPEFLEAIKECVHDCLKLLNDEESDEKGSRRSLALNFHRKVVQNTQDPLFWTKVYSSKTCYGCLCCSPQYVLPCGHAFCEDCVRDFGQRGDRGRSTTSYTHDHCLLCGVWGSSIGWPWTILLKPKSAGVRLLSLDGGGVRGVAELEILRRLETEIGLHVPITDFFDLIVGTSIGGLIAIGIGINRWDLVTCLQTLKNLTKAIFKEKPFAKAWGIGWVSRLLYESIYDTKRLESHLQTIFSSKPFFGISRNESATAGSGVSHTRIAITTTVDTSCRLFTNYQVHDEESSLYLDSNTKVWEVARCTSAAPMYFTSYLAPLVGAECRDGGLRSANPVQLAANEGRKIWANTTNLDLLLSIGTGYSEVGTDPPSTWKLLPDWVQPLFANFTDNMNGEKMYLDFMRNADESLRVHTRRLIIKFRSPMEPALDEVKMLDSIQSETVSYNFDVKPNNPTGASQILGDNKIKDVALRLQASLFFYQPSSVSQNANEVYAVSGTIYCRLDTGTDSLKTFLTRIRGFCFNGQELKIPSSVHDAVRDENEPFMLAHSFNHSAAEEAGPVKIEVMFANRIRAPISGFPCTILVRGLLKKSCSYPLLTNLLVVFTLTFSLLSGYEKSRKPFLSPMDAGSPVRRSIFALNRRSDL
ncbi:hypothetical protein MMC07_004806 [Pseudocyphellaria aurata]|nr:hypothetical protein [Pseudocyphellaria aurata]